MNEIDTLPAFSAIIVAAGQGLRASQEVPKQFARWRGAPVLRHSAARLLEMGADPLIIAIAPGQKELARTALAGLEGYILVEGGDTRQQSVSNALSHLGGGNACDRVLIHDAARPDIPGSVIARLLGALDDSPGAIPVLPVVDSLVKAGENTMEGTARRETLRRVQTPQAFRFRAILEAHAAWTGAMDAGDDAQVLHAAGRSVALVKGDERLAKLTFAEDFMSQIPPIRTGMGYDVHRLVEGEELWLCGIRIEHDRGLSGHSDADVGLHAITDAILGAVAMGDIGQHFPPSDPQWAGASSDRFLEHAAKLAATAGYTVANIDVTLICEAPKIGPHREAMRSRIARILNVADTAISVKATTTERLGFTGRGEGIAAQAVATMVKEA